MHTAIILAGGRSTRMGQDKASLLFMGEPLLTRVIDRLAADLTIVVAAPEQLLPDLSGRDVLVVRDDQPGKGPLGGLYTGLRFSPTQYSSVVACDMPFTNAALLEYTLDVAQRREYEVALPYVDGQLQFLHGAYSRSLVPALEESLRGGKLALHEFVGRRNLRILADAEVAQFRDREFQYNVNTPAEMSRALRRAARAANAAA